MGCGSSVVTQGNMPHLCGLKLECDMTYEQKYLIRETVDNRECVNEKDFLAWRYVCELAAIFLNMHPGLQTYFSEFKHIKIDNINGSHGHPRRLLMAIDNAVTALGDSDSFSAYLVELGRRHHGMNFRPGPTHFNDLRKCFLSVIKEILATASLWDFQVEEAWNRLFDSITAMMLRGIQLAKLNAFRSCFISVVHEILAMAYLWDPEVEQAWNRLFDYITISMLRGIQLAKE
ncbi:predicted protein [Nematostella vectensis]|uniref:Globin domain-containing protein n=1 Tax=Nematostella vectensis TaxID=45351 RepID=A7RWR5_NEMVE|nr:predicted protein [Nematostella vectensis]|eukprot:XP_001636078.1 predicted protein [Nematostella vectensis]